MKKIGFLSFGHWQAIPGSLVRTAADSHLQTIELAVAAEELGIDGAFVRVHHFAPQLASPFPLLAAIAARTSKIEMGTAVIDMRYENPLYMAEEAAATDLIAAGRLQLGISRGSPGHALDGPGVFGYTSQDGTADVEAARQKALVFLAAIKGAGLAESDPVWTRHRGLLPIEPRSEGLAARVWWGAGNRQTAQWAAEHGMNLQSSTLLTEDTGKQMGEAQAEQIQVYRKTWAEAGWDREPRVSVSRSIMPLTTAEDWQYFGGRRDDVDQVGQIAGMTARFGRSYIGEPDQLVEELANDQAIAEADTLMLTVPNQLGVDYNAHLLENVLKYIAPALGWR